MTKEERARRVYIATRIRYSVELLVAAEVAYSWRGSGSETAEGILLVEGELRDARRAFRASMYELEHDTPCPMSH